MGLKINNNYTATELQSNLDKYLEEARQKEIEYNEKIRFNIMQPIFNELEKVIK